MTILLTIALGIVSGISEGMVMIRPGDALHSGKTYEIYPVHMRYMQAGVREHCWVRWYHVIDVAAYLLCAALVYTLWVHSFPNWVQLTGLAFLLWETREIGYAFARYLSWRGATENVYGLGVTAAGHQVTVLHAVRTMLALGFLLG